MDEFLKNGAYIVGTFFTSGLIVVWAGKFFGESISKFFMSKMEIKFNKELEEYKSELESRNAKEIEEYKAKLESINNKELSKLNSELSTKNYVTEVRFNTEFEVYREISLLLYYAVDDINIFVSSVILKRINIFDKTFDRYVDSDTELHKIINKNRFLINYKILSLLDIYREKANTFSKILLDKELFQEGQHILKYNLNKTEVNELEEIMIVVTKLREEIYLEMKNVIDNYVIIN